MAEKAGVPPPYTTTQPQTQQVVQPMVVTQQPAVVIQHQHQVIAAREWSSGLLDCFSDMKSCALTLFCFPLVPCCMAARMGENCCVGASGGLVTMRAVLRTKHGIRGDICNDCCTIYCCGPCAACQMSREMNHLQYPPKDCCC